MSMKLPRFAKMLIAIELLLIVFIRLAPTQEAISAGGGLWGPKILLSRIRDFWAVPVSCGLLTVLAGTFFLSGIQKREPRVQKGRVCPFFLGFAAMAVVGIYWTVSTIRLVRAPLIPERPWLYLVTRRGWFCLWWAAAGCLLLCALYKSKSIRPAVEK